MTLLQADSDAGALTAALHRTRRLTEALAQPLSAEDQTVQSMPDTSPTKWHRAHTTWFFETFLLKPYLDDYAEFDKHFGYLFNSYYEAVGARHPRPDRGMVTRPGIADIAAYRVHVDEAMTRLMERVADNAALATELDPLIRLGINHEQQHQELLLMDIKHVLANNIYGGAYVDRPHTPAADPGEQGWVNVDGGIYEIGFDPAADADAPAFWFDNEGPRHEALVPAFKLADRLVTCGEWLEFMADGGYWEPALWLSDGWHRRNAEGWEAPQYWKESEDGWQLHTLTGRRGIDPNEPVCHLSFYEADAFATWAGARLPTEFEWEAAATQAVAAGTAGQGEMLSQDDPLTSALHPTPAGAPSEIDGAPVLRQLLGDCWEWTGSPYRPYPGYQAPDGAIGEYNGKFMVNTIGLRGGCAFTPDDHLRLTYRNFFHPHTRWHLSGVRLAADS